jgi:hypothetical protein
LGGYQQIHEGKTMKRPSKEELKNAQDIIDRERKYQDEIERLEKMRYVGKFFRYRNSRGDKESWWLYAAITSVNDGPFNTLRGWIIQQTSLNSFEIDFDARCEIFKNYEEITPKHFWFEVDKILGCLTETISKER